MGILNVLPPTLFKTKLFEGLEQAELRALVNKGNLITAEAGRALINEGEVGEDFYFVVSGLLVVQIAKANKDNPIILTTLKEGSVLGEMILLKKNTRTATVVVEKNAELIKWNYKDCLDLFIINPALGYKIMRNLAVLVSDRLSDMNVLYRDK